MSGMSVLGFPKGYFVQYVYSPVDSGTHLVVSSKTLTAICLASTENCQLLIQLTIVLDIQWSEISDQCSFFEDGGGGG